LLSVLGEVVEFELHLEWAGGLAALGVAQIRRDNAELLFELVEWVERVGREPRDRRVQPTAGMTSRGKPEPASS
jgi:hypothetical protein